MKAIRLTEAEARAIAEVHALVAGGPADFDEVMDEHAKPWRSFMAKVAKAREPSANVAVAPIETALVAAARCKVVPLVTGHGQASVRAGKLGVTPEQARLVGQYIASQGWLRGPLTLLDVLNKWPTYLSKATATQPPPSVPAGLNGGTSETAAPGTAGASQRGQEGRAAPGFGRVRPNAYPDGPKGR